MNYLKRAINLAKVFSANLSVSTDIEGLILVFIDYLWKKESKISATLEGFSGRGLSIEEACKDFLGKANGGLLVYDPPEHMGKRKEVVVVSI